MSSTLRQKTFSGTADVPDAGQQFIEVVARRRPLEPLIVQGEALDEVLAQALRGPDAELGAAMGLDPVADGDDDVEVVSARPGRSCRRRQLSGNSGQLNPAPIRLPRRRCGYAH